MDWFAALPSDEVHALEEPITAAQTRARTAATRFFHDQELGAWVADHNDARGLTPRTSAVALQHDQIDSQLAGVHGVARGPPRANLGQVKNRMYFTRWRKRVGVKIGQIPASGGMSTEDKRAKVLTLLSTRRTCNARDSASRPRPRIVRTATLALL